VYHRVSLVPGRLDARVALSAYQVDMRDELDFDLASFRYVNIGRSRHRGVEAGLTIGGPAATSAFVNYTRQDATSRLGEHSGRFLKAVPRRVVAAGVARASAAGVSASLTATSVGATYLDDANARTLPARTQVDARATYPVRGLTLSLDVRNLLGARYSSTGFPDPAGGPTTYYYPAATRVVMAGVGAGW
jgi:outer membrane receptor protein involved in Fe transport